MGAHQSKEELVYREVNYGSIEGIKSLRRDGAGLEWTDKEGKTPLMLACMRPDLLNVAKVLIELGANVNAYRPEKKYKKTRKTRVKKRCHAGTPLHHAAKRGLEETVNLLLSNGANPLVINDNCQTPLDLARTKGHCNVVRSIESRICLFCGWLRELYGPSILEVFAPQWMQRKIWAVVLPCDSRNPMAPRKFELAIYPDLQVAQPRVTVALWKVHIEEPKFSQQDPTLLILDKASKTKYKFLSALEGDKLQLQRLYNACQGISQQNSHIPVAAPPGAAPTSDPSHLNPNASAASAPAHTPVPEDVQLAMAINASIQSALVEGVPLPNPQPVNLSTNTNNGCGASSEKTTFNGWGQSSGAPPATKLVPTPDPYNGWAGVGPSSSSPQLHTRWLETPTVLPSAHEAPPTISVTSAPPVRPSSSLPQLHTGRLEIPTVVPSAHEASPTISVPSAPLIEQTFYSGPVQYPTIDCSPVDLIVPPPDAGKKPEPFDSKDGGGGGGSSSSSSALASCVICLDAPVEGACIPCGHMAGCMSCLGEIKGKSWGCPVCRANIDQVIRLYAV